MAGWASTYGANSVLNGTAMPATLYCKLHTGNPSAAGTSNAAAETTRKSFTKTTSTVGATSNVAALTWASYPAAETITHVSWWDASTAGNCWGVAALLASKTMAIGETLECAIGDFDIALDIWA